VVVRIASASVAAVVVVALALAACGDDDDSGTGDTGTPGTSGTSGTVATGSRATITAANIAFDPTELTVGAGETITLRNDDDVEHSFTIDDPAIDAEAEGGEEATVDAPDEPGTYDFHCRYHPDQMTGVLTVS
jgi:plastocyanin